MNIVNCDFLRKSQSEFHCYLVRDNPIFYGKAVTDIKYRYIKYLYHVEHVLLILNIFIIMLLNQRKETLN